MTTKSTMRVVQLRTVQLTDHARKTLPYDIYMAIETRLKAFFKEESYKNFRAVIGDDLETALRKTHRVFLERIIFGDVNANMMNPENFEFKVIVSEIDSDGAFWLNGSEYGTWWQGSKYWDNDNA